MKSAISLVVVSAVCWWASFALSGIIVDGLGALSETVATNEVVEVAEEEEEEASLYEWASNEEGTYLYVIAYGESEAAEPQVSVVRETTGVSLDALLRTYDADSATACYLFKVDPGRSYTLSVSCEGCVSESLTIDVSESEELYVLEFILELDETASSTESSADSDEADDAMAVAATVNGVEIYESTITASIEDFRAENDLEDDEDWIVWLIANGSTPESIREEIIDSYIERELVLAYAEELGIEVDEASVDASVEAMVEQLGGEDAWEAYLEDAGMTEEEYRAEVEFQLIYSTLRAYLMTPESTVSADGLTDEELELAQEEAYETWYGEALANAEIVVYDMPEDVSYYVDLSAYEHEGHHYYVVDVAMTWDDAQAYCEELGGHLVTITSEGEQEFVAALIEDRAYSCYLIGLSLDLDEYSTWVTGEEVTYTNWADGEPHYYSGSYVAVILTRDDGSAQAGQWADFSGSAGRFVCEWDE